MRLPTSSASPKALENDVDFVSQMWTIIQISLKFVKENNSKLFTLTANENLVLNALISQILFGDFDEKAVLPIPLQMTKSISNEWKKMIGTSTEQSVRALENLLTKKSPRYFMPYLNSHLEFFKSLDRNTNAPIINEIGIQVSSLNNCQSESVNFKPGDSFDKSKAKDDKNKATKIHADKPNGEVQIIENAPNSGECVNKGVKDCQPGLENNPSGEQFKNKNSIKKTLDAENMNQRGENLFIRENGDNVKKSLQNQIANIAAMQKNISSENVVNEMRKDLPKFKSDNDEVQKNVSNVKNSNNGENDVPKSTPDHAAQQKNVPVKVIDDNVDKDAPKRKIEPTKLLKNDSFKKIDTNEENFIPKFKPDWPEKAKNLLPKDSANVQNKNQEVSNFEAYTKNLIEAALVKNSPIDAIESYANIFPVQYRPIVLNQVYNMTRVALISQIVGGHKTLHDYFKPIFSTRIDQISKCDRSFEMHSIQGASSLKFGSRESQFVNEFEDEIHKLGTKNILCIDKGSTKIIKVKNVKNHAFFLQFMLESSQIKFGLNFISEKSKIRSTILELKDHDFNLKPHVFEALASLHKSGQFELVFDNSNSFFSQKKLFLKVRQVR